MTNSKRLNTIRKDCENCEYFLTEKCPVEKLGFKAFDKRIIRRLNRNFYGNPNLHCKRWRKK